MPITPEQREARRQHIGSSEVAAVLGLDTYRTPADVYYEKVHVTEDTTSAAAEAGNWLQHPLLQWASEQLGLPIEEDVSRVDPLHGILSANHDALIVGKPLGMEAKTANITGHNPAILDQWGDEQTDEIPDAYLIQCQAQMLVSDLQLVWVPALIGGRGRCMFKVERDEDLIAKIRARCEAWWQQHIVARVPPADSVPSLDILKRIKREPEKVVQIPAGPVEAWLAAKDAEADAKARLEAAQAAMLVYVGDAEAGDSPLGRVTYKLQKRAEYTVKASEFRVLRYQKPKGIK